MHALPKTRTVLVQGRADGLHHGAQVFVSHRGKTICDAATGEVRPGEPLTAEHRMLWLSSGKPLTAAAAVRFCVPEGNGERRLDRPVAEFIPEFAAGGKGNVTVRHILTHTGGFPDAAPDYPEVSWEESIRRLCAALLEEGREPGRTAGYHPKSSWFILGELVRRWSGAAGRLPGPRPDFDEIMRSVVLEPCWMEDCGFALRPDEARTLRPALAPMFQRRGQSLVETDHLAESALARSSPGSSFRGRARELGTFYEVLAVALSTREGDGFLNHSQAEALTARHRVGEYDRTLGHVVDFGLGVIVDSNRYGADTVPYGFGPHCSPRTFGHGGSQSSMAFCDPEHELVVAWATNGMCGEPKHQRRNRAINAAIYEDLGLAD